ncbi:O-antigen ligase family protein [Methylobacterium sp. CM6257]
MMRLTLNAAALALSLYFLVVERFMLCLNGTIALLLLPPGLRFEPLYTIALNGALVTALGTWLAWPRAPSQWSGTCILMALLIAWAAMSMLWAADLSLSRHAMVAWLFGFTVLFLTVNRIRSIQTADTLMLVLGSNGWIIVISSFYTVMFTSYDFNHRLKVLGINENMLGTLLILMLPGVIWPVLRSSGKRRLALMMLSIVYILGTMVFAALSGSRGSTISLALTLLAFLSARSTRPWGIFGLVLLTGVLVAAPFLLNVVLQRFAEGEGGEMGGRVDLWEASVLFIVDQPFTGAGVGNGPLALHDYIASVTSSYNRHTDLPSHQPFLEVGVDVGVVGIALYTATILTALWSFVRSRAAWAAVEGAPEGYHMVVAGATTGYLVSWFKGGGQGNHPTFFLLLALLLLPAHLARAQMVSGGTGRPRVVHRPGAAEHE